MLANVAVLTFTGKAALDIVPYVAMTVGSVPADGAKAVATPVVELTDSFEEPLATAYVTPLGFVCVVPSENVTVEPSVTETPTGIPPAGIFGVAEIAMAVGLLPEMVRFAVPVSVL
jgi:hypothetical protein